MKISINNKLAFINNNQFSKYKKELVNKFFHSKVFSCITLAMTLSIVTYGAISLYGRVKKKENISPEIKKSQLKPPNEENLNILSQLIEIRDFPFFEEINYIFKGSLDIEMDKIHEHLSISENKAILKYIKQEKNQNDAFAILWVILGIKPVAVFETSLDRELRNLIVNVLNLDAYKNNLKFTETQQKFPKYYFVNEQPLETFDPRHYLTKLLPFRQTNSIAEAVTYCFPNQGSLQTDQILSYLLGFGPSCEAYALNASRFSDNSSTLNQFSDLSFSCLGDKHYFEIGNVLNSLILNDNSLNAKDLCKTYHKELPELAKNLNCKKSWLDHQTQYDNVYKNFKNLGIQFIFDRITSETDYFKKSYSLRTWVFKTWLPSTTVDS